MNREGSSIKDYVATNSTTARSNILALIVVFVACLSLLIVTLLGIRQAMGPREYLLSTDFRAYYTAGQMVLGGVRRDFYDLTTQLSWQQSWAPEVSDISELMPFLNPPFTSIPLAIVATLPIEMAYLIWGLANVILLGGICLLLLKTTGELGPKVTFRAIAMSLTFVPVLATLMQGQMSFVIVLSLLLSWRAFRLGKDLQGGAWLALLAVKPQLALLPILVLVMKRRIRSLIGLGLGGVASLLASLLMVGWDGMQGYVHLLISASSFGDAYTVHPQRMHTWRGLLHFLLGTDEVSQVQVWWLVGVALAVGLLMWSWRGEWAASSRRFSLQWALLVVTMLFVSPHANTHDLSVLIVPGALVLCYQSGHKVNGLLHRVLIALPYIAYLAVFASLFGISFLRLQPTVLAMVLALFVVSYAAANLQEQSAAQPR